MHGRRRERASILVAVALCALAWPAGASAISQTAASSGDGMWLSGEVGSDSAIPGYGDDPDFGGLVSYSLTLVDPGKVVHGDGPVGDEADMRRPWLSMLEEHALPPENGSSGWLREVRELCSAFVNPGGYDVAYDEDAGTLRVSADVACDDGRGFDFYRLTWTGDVERYTGSVNRADAGWGWGSWYPGSWHGGINVVETAVEPRMLWRAEMSLCGVRDGEAARCLYSWIAWGELDAAIVAYAERN